MKRFKSILKKTIIGLLAAVILFFGGVWTFNIFASRSDNKKIIDYGERIDVYGSKMNVVSYGEGKETILLFPGYGTPSPNYDFKPLVEELKDEYRVIVVEPFGYGLSDTTKIARSNENIVKEIHELAKQLELDEFIFMGHSIAGLYVLNYANTYPGQLKAFVGVDTSVPGQPTASLPIGLFKFARGSGLMRLSVMMSEQTQTPDGLTDIETAQNKLLSIKVGMNNTQLNELSNLASNLDSSMDLKLPEALPVLLFVQEHNAAIPNWQELHEKQIENSKTKEMYLVDGDHYLHHKNSPFIAEKTKSFLNKALGN